MAIDPDLRRALAPGGTLRVALNDANFLLVQRAGDSGDTHGVAPALGRAIADCAGLPVRFVHYANAGLMADAAADNAWDLGFMGIEPARAERIAFTAGYIAIEAGYLVRQDSALRSVEEVDRPGVRIAVAARSAYDLFLTRTLVHADLVRAESIPASLDLFLEQRLEVLASLKARLIDDVRRIPGLRLLDGAFTTVQQGVGVPAHRLVAVEFLRSFIEEAKRSGLVQRLVDEYEVAGVSVPG